MFGILFCFLVAANVGAQEKHIAASIDSGLYLDKDGNVWTWGDSKLSPDINRRIPHLVMQNGHSVFASPDEPKVLHHQTGRLALGMGCFQLGATGRYS